MSRDGPGWELEVWFEPRILKSGRAGKSGTWQYAWVSPLRWCELCGRFGTARTVRQRDDLYDGWLMELRKWQPLTLCTGCWNRLRPIFRNLRELDELRVIARRLARGVT